MKFWLLIGSLLLSGCASTGDYEEAEKIEQLQATNNYSGLVEYYKGKMLLEPGDWHVQLKLADAYFNNQDLESAEFYIDRILSGAPKPEADAYLLKGKIQSEKQQYQLALRQFTIAGKSGLESAELFLYKGIAYGQTRQYALAEKSFNQARIRGTNDAIVKNNIAMLHIYQGQYQQAVDILMPLYEQDSSNAKIRSNLKISLRQIELQHQAQNMTEAEPDEVSVSGDKSTHERYHLQLGSYRLREEAEQKRDALKDLGLPLQIKQVDLGEQGTWFRLLSGDLEGYSVALAYAEQHSERLAGHTYFIQVSQ